MISSTVFPFTALLLKFLVLSAGQRRPLRWFYLSMLDHPRVLAARLIPRFECCPLPVSKLSGEVPYSRLGNGQE